MTDVRTSDKTGKQYAAGYAAALHDNMRDLEAQLLILAGNGELSRQHAYEIFAGTFNAQQASLRFPEPTGQFDATQIDQYREGEP